MVRPYDAKAEARFSRRGRISPALRGTFGREPVAELDEAVLVRLHIGELEVGLDRVAEEPDTLAEEASARP